ncbi:helix-turn-helix domain-containing protein [Mucilaginibacter ginkgonis]|uniref:Transcriptional regulator n=1 Tax=Mucilaginibacter ginkgonis TaxID=2682091 RepID=A0A6I4HVM7_9SPHI|nr:transcriptional regulator [Mucilaginibacter ginkgonis]QQL50376.1 transcriptional regulator [Mucilaginibacter ginkgonis]
MASFKILKNESDYNEAVNRAIEIFDAEPGNPHFDELEILGLLIKDYEDKHHPIPIPNPVEVIKYKLNEKGLKNKDLIPLMGSEGHVSAILSGKRRLTLDMVKDLVGFLDIPADKLLG